MKFFSNISNGLFWLVIVAGVVFFFTIPSPQKTVKFKRLSKQLFVELKYPFELPPLKFAYNALEPHMDEQTLKIHHTKHHQGYVDNLNKAMEQYPEYQIYSLENLLANLNALPEALKNAVKSHGGGHFNHTLFWTLLCKQVPNSGISDVILEKISKDFESFENFKQEFAKQAVSIIGSGWVWLCVDQNGKFKLVSSYNHETPYTQNLYPILVLDVWEHSFYLQYLNDRAKYVDEWWKVVNWEDSDKKLEKALK